MERRLLEFAQQGAAREHNYYTEGIETLESGGHKGEFKNCPHPDCQLVHALPAEDRAVTAPQEQEPPFADWASDIASERENFGYDNYCALIEEALRKAHCHGQSALTHAIAALRGEMEQAIANGCWGPEVLRRWAAILKEWEGRHA